MEYDVVVDISIESVVNAERRGQDRTSSTMETMGRAWPQMYWLSLPKMRVISVDNYNNY